MTLWERMHLGFDNHTKEYYIVLGFPMELWRLKATSG